MLNTNLVPTNDHVVMLGMTNRVAALGEHAKVLVPHRCVYLPKEIGVPRPFVLCRRRNLAIHS